jgi:type 1 glutamine amidotransferase
MRLVVMLAVVTMGCAVDDPGPADSAPSVDASSVDASDGGETMWEDATPGVEDAGRRDASPPAPLRVLVFSRTTGFRHASIEEGVAALRAMGSGRGWVVEATEDPERFDADSLREIDVVVFLCTTGNVLGPTEESAFEQWFRAGGGFVGVHSASDTEYDWPFYAGVIGAYFAGHPAIQPARLEVVDRTHPATMHLDDEWNRRDEWYDFREDPSARVRVLLRIDASSYEGSTTGDHPVAWAHEPMGGRAFYTALGHTSESYAEPAMLAHLEGAIRWAAAR